MAETPKRFLRIRQVIDRVGLRRTALRDKVKRGEFPAPYPLGARAVAWLEADVDAWIDARVKAAGGSR